MPYPTEDELLAASDPPKWIDRHFLRQDPYAFHATRVTFHETACELADSLDVERNGIFCIGSGAVGLSLNPGKIENGHLKRFDDRSDLDLAIISSRHFEIAWRELSRLTQPHLKEVPSGVQEHLAWQRKRLFDGAILSNKLLGSFSFGSEWIGAIDRIAGRLEDALDRSVRTEVWIYRDYWSLRNYLTGGIVACQNKLKLKEVVNE
jgi:hypothetical protein